MLMKDNKKNMVSVIVDRINGKEGEQKEMEAPQTPDGAQADMEMDGPSVAADEVFAALESKNKPAFIEAMRSMIECCMNDEQE